MYGRNIVALPGNQAETEKTNISLQHLEEPVYSTIPRSQNIGKAIVNFLSRIKYGVPGSMVRKQVTDLFLKK